MATSTSRTGDVLVKPPRLGRTAALLVASLMVILQILWVLLSALKSDLELTAYPAPFFPAVPLWDNFVQAVTMIPYAKHAVISLFLAGSSSALSMLTSSLVGFAFARIEAPGRRFFFGIIVALLMIPSVVTLIPQFVMYSELGLGNTYWPWILGGLAGSPFFIFLFRQFFSTFPRELEDAAEVDGCGPFRTYWQIFLPNARPVLAVAFVLYFAGVWGDWYMPLIFLNNDQTTLSVRLATSYVDPQGNDLTAVTIAASVIFTLPLIVLFAFGQRYIMQGVITSGLKG